MAALVWRFAGSLAPTRGGFRRVRPTRGREPVGSCSVIGSEHREDAKKLEGSGFNVPSDVILELRKRVLPNR